MVQRQQHSLPQRERNAMMKKDHVRCNTLAARVLGFVYSTHRRHTHTHIALIWLCAREVFMVLTTPFSQFRFIMRLQLFNFSRLSPTLPITAVAVLRKMIKMKYYVRATIVCNSIVRLSRLLWYVSNWNVTFPQSERWTREKEEKENEKNCTHHYFRSSSSGSSTGDAPATVKCCLRCALSVHFSFVLWLFLFFSEAILVV